MDELFSCRNCIQNAGQSLTTGHGSGFCLTHNSVIPDPIRTTCKFLHRKDLPGKPDIVLPKYHTVIFVHGCFWHQHSRCGAGIVPASRGEYWVPKLKRNQERDRCAKLDLARLGWKSLTVWECEIEKNPAAALRRSMAFLDQRAKRRSSP